jgi:S1-C subfamily serine protease
MQKPILLLAAIIVFSSCSKSPEPAQSQTTQSPTSSDAGDSKSRLQAELVSAELRGLLGKGKPEDIAKLFELREQAAMQGDARSQYNLGAMYLEGEGVPKDNVKAAEWWRKAAEQGLAEAQAAFGSAFAFGTGVPKDSAKAVEWWEKAAAQGLVRAQSGLGAAYAGGIGVPRDLVLGYAWANLAAAGGSEKINDSLQAAEIAKTSDSARELRDMLPLSPSDRAEAQRLSSNWKQGQILRREGDSESWPDDSAAPGGIPSKKSTGTAFVVSADGHAITNNHVVAGCKELRVQGGSEQVRTIARDEVSDLALLKLPGRPKAVAVLARDSASLRQGQDIVVFGFPLDSVLSSGGNLTPGVVSAITGLGNNSNQIQITAPIQPGSSGSPVMDKKGHVVAVVNMKLSDSVMAKTTGTLPQSVNFAINGQTVKAFLDANKVPYKSGVPFLTWEKSLADLGDEARKWTTVVECWE